MIVELLFIRIYIHNKSNSCSSWNVDFWKSSTSDTLTYFSSCFNSALTFCLSSNFYVIALPWFYVILIQSSSQIRPPFLKQYSPYSLKLGNTFMYIMAPLISTKNTNSGSFQSSQCNGSINYLNSLSIYGLVNLSVYLALNTRNHGLVLSNPKYTSTSYLACLLKSSKFAGNTYLIGIIL